MKNNISPRAFMRGMAVVVAVYAIIAGWAWMQSNAEQAALESTLPQQTAIIERGEKPTHTVQQNDEHTVQDVENAAGENNTEQDVTETTPDIAQPTPAEPEMETAIAGTAVDYMENGMAVAPIAGLHQTTPDGVLPIVRDTDRLRPFDAYRRPFRPMGASGAPIISIVINDIGISDSLGDAILKDLPPEITVAINPYATAPEEWIKKSRAAGHEAWLKLPSESKNYPLSDPGPQTLLTNALEKQNLEKLYWILARGTGYVGVISDKDSAFIKSLNDMRPIIGDVYRRGLGFVDGDMSATNVPRTMAIGLDAPYAHADLWIDQSPNPADVASALTQLERLAANRGTAIGFMNATPLTIKAITEWAPGLKGKGLVLAPLSAATRISQ